MKGNCSGCGNDTFIQNKKYNLCGECVFKKSHGGKSKQEVYQERQISKAVKKYNIQPSIFHDKKIVPPISFKIIKGGLKKEFFQDEESLKNEKMQNDAERREKEESGWNHKYNAEHIEGFLKQAKKIDENQIKQEELKPHKTYFKQPKSEKKKPKAIKKVSGKQSVIERAYHITCADMDYTTEPVCTGCLQYQGGDIKLSHSHIISRADCKAIGREDLISDRDNLTYHCLDFGENTGCHRKWENPKERITLADYEKNLQYIKTIDQGLYLRYIDKS